MLIPVEAFNIIRSPFTDFISLAIKDTPQLAMKDESKTLRVASNPVEMYVFSFHPAILHRTCLT